MLLFPYFVYFIFDMNLYAILCLFVHIIYPCGFDEFSLIWYVTILMFDHVLNFYKKCNLSYIFLHESL